MYLLSLNIGIRLSIGDNLLDSSQVYKGIVMNRLSERQQIKQRDYADRLSRVGTMKPGEISYNLAVLMKLRDLLEEELASTFRERGMTDERIVEELNRITGRAKFAVSMEQRLRSDRIFHS